MFNSEDANPDPDPNMPIFGYCTSDNKIPAHGPNKDGCCMNSESGGGCCPDFINVYDVADKVKTIRFPSSVPVHWRTMQILFFLQLFQPMTAQF